MAAVWWAALTFAVLLRASKYQRHAPEPHGVEDALPQGFVTAFTVLGYIIVGTGLCFAVDVHPLESVNPEPNQIAGALLAFAPWWILRLRTEPSVSARSAAGSALAATLVVWWILPSRGVMLALAVAAPAWGLWAVARFRPPRRLLPPKRTFIRLTALFVGLALAVFLALDGRRPPSTEGGAVVHGPDTYALRALERLLPDDWLLQGQLEGLRWSSLLEGRPTIWQQAWWSAADFPLGFGPGTYGATVPVLYPLNGPTASHAHQGLLQRHHELGRLGAVSWLVLWLWSGFRLARAAVVGTKPTVAALATAWLALGTFQLFDALPIADGSALGAAAILGAGFSLRYPSLQKVQRPNHSQETSEKTTVLGHLLSIGLFFVLTMLPARLEDPAARRGAHSLVSPESEGECPTIAESTSTRALWIGGLCQARLEGEAGIRNRAWSLLLEGPEPRLELMAYQMPGKASMARKAVRQHPDRCEAWRWLGHAVLRDGDRDGAEQAWIKALERCPDDADTWLALARLRRSDGRDRQAVAAYAQACEGGDPQAGACFEGGWLAQTASRSAAEDRDDLIATAWRLYSRSRLPQAATQLQTLATEQAERPEQ